MKCKTIDMKKLVLLLFGLFGMVCGMQSQVALPYYEDFEQVLAPATLPGSWFSLGGEVVTRIDRDVAHSGHASLRIGRMEITSPECAWIALPIMEASAGVLELDFWLAAEHEDWGGTFEVGYYTDLMDTSSFVVVESYSSATIGIDYVEKVVRFAGAPTGAVIGFRVPLRASGWRVDDVYVQRSGNCLPVERLWLEALDTTRVTVAWSGMGSAASWRVTVREGSDTVVNSPVVDSVYQITGLVPNEEYWLFVATECDMGGLSSSRYLRFRTPCVGATLPYREDFDAVEEGEMPECWRIVEQVTGQHVGVKDASNSTRSTSPYLNMQSIATVVSPLSAVALNQVEVSFDVLRGSVGSEDTIMVGYLTNMVGEVTWIDTLLLEPGRRGEYVPFRTHFSGSGVAQPGYVAIRREGRYYNEIGVDNFEMNVLSGCARPEGLRVLSLYAHEATFGWRSVEGAVGYDLAYSIEDEVDGDSAMVVNVEDTTVVVSGLQPNREYFVWLRAACANGVSPWVRYGSLRMPCEPFPSDSLPMVEDFEGSLSMCWTTECYGDWCNPEVAQIELWGREAAHSGRKGVCFQNTHLALPLMEAPVNSLQLSFYVHYEGATPFAVGVMGDPRDLATFDTLYAGVTGAEWIRVVVPFGVYTGRGSFLAIRSGGYMYVDDISVDTIGECPSASNLVLNAASEESITLSWTENGSADAWEVVCIRSWDTIRMIAYTNSLFEIEGLAPRTEYLIYITPLCYGGTAPAPLEGRFSTQCTTVEDLPWIEDFSWMAVDAIPTCWSDGTEGGANRPSWRVYDDAGNRCLRVLNNRSGEATVSTPQIVVPDSSYELVFDYAHRAENDLLRVWIDAGEAHNVDSLGSTATVSTLHAGTMEHSVVSLAQYAGDTIEVRFCYAGDALGGAVFLDNVSVRQTSLCPRVAVLEVDSVRTTSVRVHWSPQDDITSYEVVYGLSGFTPDFWDALVVRDTMVWISGLQPNTHYDIYVRCVCDDYGEAHMVGFVTRCEAIELPYLESFNSYPHGEGQMADCWTVMRSANNNAFVDDFGNYYFFFDTSTISGNALRLYGGNVVAAPGLPLPLNQVDVSFRLAANRYVGEIQVGFLRSLDDPLDSMVVLDTYRFNTPYDFVEGHHFAIETTIADSGFIIFKCLGDNEYDYVWIDDFKVRVSGSCAVPANLALRTLSYDNATIGWIGEGDSYEVRYCLSNDSTTYQFNNSTTEQHILVGLSPATTYQVQARSICGGDTSEWSLPLSFTTRCAPAALPFVYTFENSLLGDDVIFDSCWIQSHIYTLFTPYVSDDHNAGLAPVEGSNYLMFDGVQGEYVALPLMDASLDDIVLRFMAREYLDGSGAEVSVGVMDNPYDTATFVEVANLPIYGRDYAEFRCYFVDYQGSGRTIAIKSQGVAFLIDSVVVDYIPTCPEPINLRTTSVGSLNAVVEWTEVGSASSWMVQYRPFYVSDWITLPTVTGVPRALLSGLNPATPYEVRVQALCSSSLRSEWSRSLTFTTLCDEPSVPYNIDFELPLGTLPHCFEVLSYTSTLPAVREDYYAFNNATRYLLLDHPCEVASPHLAAPLNQLLVEFDLYFANGSDTLLLGSTADGRFHALDTLTLPADLPVGEPYHVMVDCSTSQISDSVSVHFRYLSDHFIAIDNLYIDRLPSCPPVESLTLLETTSSSITIDWEDRGTPTSWQVRYAPTTQQLNNSTIQQYFSHPVTISGLDAQTSYDFYVRPICGEGDTGAWVRHALRASTDCPVRFLPYEEDFLHVGGTAYNVEGVIPPCWESYSNATLAYAHPHVGEYGLFIYSYSDHALIMMAGSVGYGDTSVVRLPRFYQPLNSVTLRFYLRTVMDYPGILEVGYLTGASLANDFVALREYQSENYNYGRFDSVSYGEVPPEAQSIAFRWTAPASSEHFASCCLDEISVTSTVASCEEPVILATDSTYESYTLTWEGIGNDYELGYRPQSSLAYTPSIIVHGTTYTISGLEPAEHYTLRLRQRCDAQHASEWIFLDFATDTMVCSAPTGLHQLAADASYTSVTLDWEGGADSYIVKLFNSRIGEIRDTVAVPPATLYGLTAGETYQATLQSLCGNRYEFSSPWSDTLTCSTLDCLPVSELRCYDLTDTTVMLSWVANGEEETWMIAYGYQGFGQGEEMGSVVADHNPYQLSLAGFDSFSDYEVYLYAQCAPGVTSIPSGPVTFRTGDIGIPQINTSANQQINIYPNPTTGSFTIAISSQFTVHSSPINIEIVDMNGRTIKSTVQQIYPVGDANTAKSDLMRVSNDSTEIKVNGLSQGAYFVRIYGEEIYTIRKLIVR